MSIEAMKAALKALESINEISKPPMNIPLAAEIDGAMDALRKIIQEATLQKISDIGQEIEQAEKQEKLCKYCGGIGQVVCDGRCMPGQAEKPDAWIESVCALLRQAHDTLSLASLPTKREWVGLTDKEIFDTLDSYDEEVNARQIEALLKEKNT
jgi:hypothetical protein